MEALYLGTPAIVSSASCLPEIYGDTVHYIDPDDAKVNLDDLLKEPVESPEKLFEKYNWDKAARDWLNIFKSM
jgi:glycosyltransferase involved in cell wall biosynthesis